MCLLRRLNRRLKRSHSIQHLPFENRRVCRHSVLFRRPRAAVSYKNLLIPLKVDSTSIPLSLVRRERPCFIWITGFRRGRARGSTVIEVFLVYSLSMLR
jgi:hypothetical protein